eukprot:g2204.t1
MHSKRGVLRQKKETDSLGIIVMPSMSIRLLALGLFLLCATGPSGVQFHVRANSDGTGTGAGTGTKSTAAADDEHVSDRLVVPKSQSLSFRVDGTERIFEIVKGEPIRDVLSRACRTMNVCDRQQQQLVRWNVLYNREATGTTAHTFLINRCGMHADQNPRTGEFAKSNVASFLAPLFPKGTSSPQEGPQDFDFPVIEEDWVSVVVKACGVWEPGMSLLQALCLSPRNRFARRSDVVVNAGSQLGWYSLLAAKVCGVSQVYAFECHPGTAYQNMLGIVKNNAESAIRLSTAAISDAQGKVAHLPFQSVMGNRGGLTLLPSSTLAKKEVTSGHFSVPTTSIDDALDVRHVRLVTADVNGHDVELIYGARELIENDGAIDYLILEMGDMTPRRISTVAFLQDNGYIVSCIDGALGMEAGVFVEDRDRPGAGLNRVGVFVESVQKELGDLLPGKCGGRMYVEIEAGSGRQVVTVCDRNQQVADGGTQRQREVGAGKIVSRLPTVELTFCHNAFLARSEEALAGVVELAQNAL